MSASSISTGGKKSKALIVIPIFLVGTVLMMLLPLSPLVIDMFLAISISISISLLLIAIHLEKPLDLSAFPSILLFSALLRLALNVASTRLILVNGGSGTGAAGTIIQSFGQVIVGGNYVVGIAVFLLLVVINFMVITKGAGRVAEVSARFTLDAMPGKQMSIDADLASGAIDQEEAKVRREEIQREADFFGSMDGASKFVSGDAKAGLLMTAINIIVGFIIGMVQNDMSLVDAAQTYTILTVGDGLASQIPALLVSTAAGVVVTRAASREKLSESLLTQFGQQTLALKIASGFLTVLGLAPGIPALPFLTLAGGIYWAARQGEKFKLNASTSTDGAALDAEGMPVVATEREKLEDMLPVDLLELEVGFELVELVDATKGGELVDRISAIRRNLAAELGIIIPSVHIRDNLRLQSNEYRLLLSGNEVGGGTLRPGKFLAMDPTGTLPDIGGEQVKEPAFGLPARWIMESERERAEAIGFTVVDVATVSATHITEMLRSIAPELVGRTEVQELLDIFARNHPRLVDELIPNLMSLGDLIKVMRNLLREGISVRDLRTILEALADCAKEIKDPDELTERVRHRLARHITSRFRGDDQRVAALVLDPSAEEAFRGEGPSSELAQRILSSLDDAARAFASITTPPAVVCAPDVRRFVSDFLTRRIPGLSVISYREIDPRTTVRTLGVVTS